MEMYVSMATFTLQALVLNSDLLLRSVFFCFAVHIVVLNVANIRFQAKQIMVLN